MGSVSSTPPELSPGATLGLPDDWPPGKSFPD
jgi:hypothetical protein